MPDLELSKFADYQRSQDNTDQEGASGRQNAPEGNVLKNIEKRMNVL